MAPRRQKPIPRTKKNYRSTKSGAGMTRAGVKAHRRANPGSKLKTKGLYANIHAKRKRIAAGSGEKMRKVGAKGAPTKKNFIRSAKTAKKRGRA